MEGHRRGRAYRTALALLDAGVNFRGQKSKDSRDWIGTLPRQEKRRPTDSADNKQLVLDRLRESLKDSTSRKKTPAAAATASASGAERSAEEPLSIQQSGVVADSRENENESEGQALLSNGRGNANSSGAMEAQAQAPTAVSVSSVTSRQSVEIPVGLHNGALTHTSVNSSENNLVSDTVTSMAVTSTNEPVTNQTETMAPQSANAALHVHNGANYEGTVAILASKPSTDLADGEKLSKPAKNRKPDDTETETEADLNMLVASGLATQQRRPSVNNLASVYAVKRQDSLSKSDLQPVDSTRSESDTKMPEQSPVPLQATRSFVSAITATPRTLKSLSNIKAAASGSVPSTSNSNKSSSASASARTAKNSEVEERRKKLIIEARRKLQEIALLERRENEEQSTSSTSKPPEADQRNAPSPTTSHKSAASAKSESYLRKLQRAENHGSETARAALPAQAQQKIIASRQLTSSPVYASNTNTNTNTNASASANTNGNVQKVTDTAKVNTKSGSSKSGEEQRLSRVSQPDLAGPPPAVAEVDVGVRKQLQPQPESDAAPAGRAATGRYDINVPSKTLPRNFHLSSSNAAAAAANNRIPASSSNTTVPSLAMVNSPSSTNLSASGVAMANSVIAVEPFSAASFANSQLLLIDATAIGADSERRSSPETVISVSAYQGARTSQRPSVGQQNAVSVVNLAGADLQPQPRQISMSTSSYTLALETVSNASFAAKSTITVAASEAARKGVRRAIVKRNVCIQCNLMRKQSDVRQSGSDQFNKPPARKHPPLSKILLNYELVTYRLQWKPESADGSVDYGIRLFESLFIEDLSVSHDDTPWSINGKRPVLAGESSAFKKVTKPQSDKSTNASQSESLLAIDSIRENSVAHADGRLTVGDYLIEVNGIALLTQESADAAEKLINASAEVVLVVARSSQPNADEQKSDKLINKGAMGLALQNELTMLKTRYDRLKNEMKRNEVLISEMRNAVARKAKIKQVLKAQAADSAAKPPLTQNAFKTIHLEEQLVHLV